MLMHVLLVTIVAQSPIGADPIVCEMHNGTVTIKHDRLFFKSNQYPNAVPVCLVKLPLALYKGKAVRDSNGLIHITGAVNSQNEPLGEITVDHLTGELRIKIGKCWRLY